MKKSSFPKLFRFKRFILERKLSNIPNIARLIELSEDIDGFTKRLNDITSREINSISKRTEGQSINFLWYYYRKSIITATLTKRISNVEEGHWKINSAISKIRSVQLFYPSIRFGRDNEQNGIQSFMKEFRKNHFNAEFKQPGLRLHPKYKLTAKLIM